MILFVLVLLIIFALLAYRNPTLGLAGILFVLPTYLWRFKIFGLPTTFLELLLGIFLLVVLIWFHNQVAATISSLGKSNWVILLFLSAGIVSTIISPQHLQALGQLKAFILEPVLFFYALIIIYKSSSDIKLWLSALWLGAVVISGFGIIQYFTFFHLPLRFWGQGMEVERITSVFPYPNALALYLAPLLGTFIVLQIKRFNLFHQQQSWYWLGMIIMGAALLLTFSRGAWLGLLLGLAVVFWLEYSKQTLLLGILILALLGLPLVRQRLNFKDASSLAHQQLWRAAISDIRQHPILGNGLAGFPTALARQNFNGEALNYPHDVFLNFWTELGLLGLVAWVLLLLMAWQKYKQQPSTIHWAALTYLLILLLHGLVDAPYFKNDLSILFWFVLALAFLPTDTQQLA